MPEYQLNLSLVLPQVDECDPCTRLLTDRLANVRGIERAHIIDTNGCGATGSGATASAELCLHYDPNLVPLAKLKRIALDAGAKISATYRHETLFFVGLDAADSAAPLARALEALEGMVHASVNYAAGLIHVAYDTRQLDRARIAKTVNEWGARILPTPQPSLPDAPPIATPASPANAHAEASHDDHVGCAHGNAPTFLPHWMQEKWTLLLVALAGIFLLIGWTGETFLGLPPAVALLFYLLAYVAGGYDIATHALPALLRGAFDTDVLMLAAAAGAALLGEWAEGAFLLFLFSLGHAGEHYALDRARNAVNALGELMPRVAQVKRTEGLAEVPVDQLRVGDIVLVRPGDRIPVDGDIVQGSSSIDQSPITGESVPVNKTSGEAVYAGTINLDAALEVETSALARDNTLSRVMQLVQEAQGQQSPTQQFTQRFTRWFVPAVLIVVLLVIIVPPLVGWTSWHDAFYRAMLLLVAASPCALAIGTPAAVLAGIAQAARQGVLIKGGVHLENLGGLKVMAFDKTGTLTSGRFAVTDVRPAAGMSEEELLSIAAAVEQQSSHPLAQAVVQAAHARNLALPAADRVENVAGKGVLARVQGETVRIGALHFFDEVVGSQLAPDPAATVARLEAEGKSTMVVTQGTGTSTRTLGVIALADQPRPQIQTTMQKLRALGIQELVMLTGDNATVAQRIGQAAGVTDVRAGLLPGDKLDAIRQLEGQHGAIAMIGDGVNDAPALATATVGIAMGGAGTAVALETADVALMGDDLQQLPFAVGLSRASRAIIQQNLAISLGIIALLILSSVLGWLQLSGAVVLHEGSTILVVLNALRLLAYRAG